MVPYELAKRPGVSIGAYRVFIGISCHANKARRAWMSQATLAMELGTSLSNVKRWMREPRRVAPDLLEVKPVFASDGSRSNNHYRIAPFLPTEPVSPQGPKNEPPQGTDSDTGDDIDWDSVTEDEIKATQDWLARLKIEPSPGAESATGPGSADASPPGAPSDTQTDPREQTQVEQTQENKNFRANAKKSETLRRTSRASPGENPKQEDEEQEKRRRAEQIPDLVARGAL
jgi:hypothetical protein